jgi:CRISPR system Cascade subunit CasB
MSKQYELSPEVRTAFLAWWRKLHSESGPQRAARARLKRAATLTQVALEPAYQNVYQQLRQASGEAYWTEQQRDGLAAAVALAAHLKPTESPGALSVARAASADKNGDPNPVSPLRFRRLLDAPDIDSLFISLRRLLPLMGGSLDPAQLAQDLFGWGDVVRKRWAYAYNWPDTN